MLNLRILVDFKPISIQIRSLLKVQSAEVWFYAVVFRNQVANMAVLNSCNRREIYFWACSRGISGVYKGARYKWVSFHYFSLPPILRLHRCHWQRYCFVSSLSNKTRRCETDRDQWGICTHARADFIFLITAHFVKQGNTMSESPIGCLLAPLSGLNCCGGGAIIFIFIPAIFNEHVSHENVDLDFTIYTTQDGLIFFEPTAQMMPGQFP